MANITDSFDRADNDNISLNAPNNLSYTEVLNDFDIASNLLIASLDVSHRATIDSPVMGSPNYDIQCVVRTLVASGIGLIVRYIDSNNYYFARINTFSNVLGLFKVVNGSQSQIGSSYSGGYNLGNDYTLRFVCNGNSLKVYVGGVLRIDETDSSLVAAGKPGFWSDFGGMTWNNLSLTYDPLVPGGNLSTMGVG